MKIIIPFDYYPIQFKKSKRTFLKRNTFKYKQKNGGKIIISIEIAEKWQKNLVLCIKPKNKKYLCGEIKKRV